MIRLGYVQYHSNVVKRTMDSEKETTVTLTRASPVAILNCTSITKMVFDMEMVTRNLCVENTS